MRLVSLIVLIATALVLGACKAQQNLGFWYRIDPLTTTEPWVTETPDGRINPYTYQFAEQRSVGDKAGAVRKETLKPAYEDARARLNAERVKAANEVLRAMPPGQDNAVKSSEAIVKYVAERVDAQTAGENQPSDLSATAYEAALRNKDYRNRLQNILLDSSDKLAAGHLSGIIGTQNFSELTFGTTSLVSSAVATVIAPVGTKNILSAISAISTGSRDNIRQVIYNNLLGTAIVNKILLDREAARSAIRGRQSMSVEEYPADVAIADATQYHHLGSFYEGVVRLTRDVTTSAGKPFPTVFDAPAPTASVSVPQSVQADAAGKFTLSFSLDRKNTGTYTVTFATVKAAAVNAASQNQATFVSLTDGTATFSVPVQDTGIKVDLDVAASVSVLTVKVYDDKQRQVGPTHTTKITRP